MEFVNICDTISCKTGLKVEIKERHDLDMLFKHKGSFIYFLQCEDYTNNLDHNKYIDHVVYIGQTRIGFFDRTRLHRTYLDYDYFTLLLLDNDPIDEDEIVKVENKYIELYNPPLNWIGFTTYEESGGVHGPKDFNSVYKYCKTKECLSSKKEKRIMAHKWMIENNFFDVIYNNRKRIFSSGLITNFVKSQLENLLIENGFNYLPFPSPALLYAFKEECKNKSVDFNRTTKEFLYEERRKKGFMS